MNNAHAPLNSGERSIREEPEGGEINLLEYGRVLWKRKWMIAAAALLVFAVGTLRVFLQTPVYTAKGVLLIEKEPAILRFEEMFQVETHQSDYVQTQVRLLRSRSLAERTVEKLNFPAPAAADPENNADPRRSRIDAFLGGLEVQPQQGTRLVDVRFTHPDPKFSAGAVNALFDAFIEMNIESRYETTEQATEFLTDQIAVLRAEIDRQERELQSYGVDKNIIALSDRETTIVERLADINKALTDAKIDRVRKEAHYKEIRAASPEHIPEAASNPLILRLREDYLRLNREYLKKSEMFKPDYPEMRRLQADIENAKKALENETQSLVKTAYAEYQAALGRERSLEAVFNAQRAEAIQLDSHSIAYNSLKIEVENKKNLLNMLLRRQSETGVAARMQGLRTANVRVVDRAEEPLSPSAPRKRRAMMLAFMLGLFGGCGLAFLFDYLDNSVKTSEDVERAAGLPSLGVVPDFSEDGLKRGYGYGYGYGERRNKKENGEGNTAPRGAVLRVVTKPPASGIELIPHFAPKSNYAESYRSVRTALLLSADAPNLKSLVITSALPEEGKTATAANLAAALAQTGKKVLLVDADLRKPRQHRIFRVKNLAGLTNALVSDINLKDLVKPTGVPNLFLVNAGPVPPNPAELLGSERMAGLVAKLKEHFHHILFDSPPVLAVTDALVMAPFVDGLILVAWGGKTPRAALRQAAEHIDMVNIKPLGVIVNRLDMRNHGASYAGRRYYYHSYGDPGMGGRT